MPGLPQEAPSQVARPRVSEADGYESPREQGQSQPQTTRVHGGVDGGEADLAQITGEGLAKDDYAYSWIQHLSIHRGLNEYILRLTD